MHRADSWMDEAACKGHDPEIWFDGHRRWQAKAICKTCPVQTPCAALAQAINPSAGVWAGIAHDTDVYHSPMAYWKATP